MGSVGCSGVGTEPHLQLLVVPVRQVQRLDFAHVWDVAVDPGAVQTDEDPQSARAPGWIWKTTEDRINKGSGQMH